MLIFGGLVLIWCAIVETFNVKMEACSRSRSGFAIVGPLLFDFGGSFAVILAIGPFWRANHVGYDFVGVKLLKLGVIESGHRSIIGVAVNRVDVAGFLELDVIIAGMAVDDGEFEWIIWASCHYAFIDGVPLFLGVVWMERNSGMFLGRF